jgi:hypothetical protein
MERRTPRMGPLLLALGCGIALGGCGGLDGSASDAEQAKVRRYLRNVHDVACTHAKNVTRCEVQVRRSPVGREAWHCEFSLVSDAEQRAFSGVDSCWTETGSPENLRRRPPP